MFGLDFGLQYSSGDWDFGLMARDITTTVNTWAIDEEQFEELKDSMKSEENEGKNES